LATRYVCVRGWGEGDT